MKAEFDVTGAGVTTKTLAKSLLRTANVGFSDGAIRGIGIANVYNNRAAGCRRLEPENSAAIFLGMAENDRLLPLPLFGEKRKCSNRGSDT